MSGASVFSKIDLRREYHRIRIQSSDDTLFVDLGVKTTLFIYK